MDVKSGRIVRKRGLTCVSIVRIAAKGLRSRNFARTGEKSDPIDVKYLATGESFDRTDVIYVATGAIFGTIVVMRDIDAEKKGEEVKRGREGKRLHRFHGLTFPPSPFPLLPRFFLSFVIS